MDMDFLDDITFETDVALEKRSASGKSCSPVIKDIASSPNLFIPKLIRLVFFLVTVFALVWACKFGIESFYCFCRGYENHMTMGQIVQEFKDYKAEQKARADRIGKIQQGRISR